MKERKGAVSFVKPSVSSPFFPYVFCYICFLSIPDSFVYSIPLSLSYVVFSFLFYLSYHNQSVSMHLKLDTSPPQSLRRCDINN